MVDPGSKLDPVVPTCITHDDRVVSQHSGEGVHAIRGSLVRRVGGSEFHLAPLISGDTDKGVAIAEGGLGDVGLRRKAGGCPRGRGDRGLHLDLVNEVCIEPGDGMRAAVTKNRLVGRAIRRTTGWSHRAALLATLNVPRGRVRRIDEAIVIGPELTYALC